VEHPGDAEGDIGGGCRFADTPFVISEYENASHLPFPFRTQRTVDFAVAGKDSSEACYTFRGSFAGTGSALQGDWGRVQALPFTAKAECR